MATCAYCGEEINAGAEKCRSCGEWVDATRANVEAAVCPWCGVDGADPTAGLQPCRSCRREFTLHAGAKLDPKRAPPGGADRTIHSRSSGWVTHKQAEVGLEGFAYGNLDPVTGLVPVDSERIEFEDVVTIATWSKPDWWLLGCTGLVFIPLSGLFAMGALKEPKLAIIAGPFWLLTLGMLWRALGVGAWWMRVCSPERTFTFRYDAPIWRRKRFRAEAWRRAGIDVSP